MIRDNGPEDAHGNHCTRIAFSPGRTAGRSENQREGHRGTQSISCTERAGCASLALGFVIRRQPDEALRAEREPSAAQRARDKLRGTDVARAWYRLESFAIVRTHQVVHAQKIANPIERLESSVVAWAGCQITAAATRMPTTTMTIPVITLP